VKERFLSGRELMLELAETLGKAVGFLEFSNAIGEVTEIEVGDPLKVNLALKSMDPFQQLRLRNFRSLLDLAGEPIEARLKIAGRLEANDTLLELCERFTDRSAMLSEHLTNRVDQSATLRWPPMLLDPSFDEPINSLIELARPINGRLVRRGVRVHRVGRRCR
jgi:hypothetical protein